MWSKIVNPNTGRKVKVDSIIGKKVLFKYINNTLYGGGGDRNKYIFEKIYEDKMWNNGSDKIPLSGPGSTLKNTSKCSQVLNSFIYNYNCKSILDLGCGDLNWISKTPFFNDYNIKYTGVDVVETIINKHKLNYPTKTFLCRDLVNYKDIKFHSLIILRDVIFHLKNEEILSIFENIKHKFDFILITSCKNKKNKDTFNKWHYSPKNIHMAPFNKSYNYEINVDEERFKRNVYIYSHDKFYNK